MSFFGRLGKGWSMGMASLKVIRKNKQLVLFPIISGIALVVVIASFLGIFLIGKSFDLGAIEESGPVDYALTFLFYLVCYFVIVFFNVGLVHCTRVYLKGGTPSFKEGVKFSMTRLHVIAGWAVLSATIGLILKAIEENGGAVGSIVSSIVGIAWSIVTFFVVPVLAYEEVGPLKAVKRSGSIMKEKWGESLGASFSFGILTFIGILIIALPLAIIFFQINAILGITIGILAVFLIQSIVSAAEMVFIASVYHQVVEDKPVDEFGSVELDELFTTKEKKGLF